MSPFHITYSECINNKQGNNMYEFVAFSFIMLASMMLASIAFMDEFTLDMKKILDLVSQSSFIHKLEYFSVYLILSFAMSFVYITLTRG